MSRCPFCGARGVKLEDHVTLNELTWRADYCGRCGKTWPADAMERVEADGQPPTDDIPMPRTEAAPKVVHFGAKVADLAERIKQQGRDWKHAQAGER